MARWVAGLDGCRGAWAGALIDLDAPTRWRCARFRRVIDLLGGPEAPVCAGIDVPIGLPDRVRGGGRSADRAARAFLGAGRSSVFPVPPRAAVYAASYDAAKALSRAGSEPPFAPSIQCWNILRYVREVDDLLRGRPDLATRLHEVHPEVAFFRLNGDRRLAAGKKGPARLEGLSARRALLIAAGLPEALVRSAPPAGIGADDHLDAMAALVVARDIAADRAEPLPNAIERDSYGLPIVIWAPAAPDRPDPAPMP
ncbi:MAG TPA: DUF429 domain-containing protein [Methylobacterium sp.]|jgi:predicted RNase H-like nuclease|uniref:DUF429 domain-containing protein n=1 Tax=Methylorubrum sp. B1-46 TaxID=2897334 RepID=UPI001E552E95|nr:DUF429 domain-containing protein [Methylorubrum sp. B1-46]UGB27519.1 DUF429 domain-containing protein [Methylorubrum sp. B1-46]HEV2544892.1 DUF429 domain-containing protein [Methylobacterium sp.]